MTTSEITKALADCQKRREEDQTLAASLSNGISSSDLYDFLLSRRIVIGGSVGVVNSIEVVLENGSRWNPVNLAVLHKGDR